MKSLILAAGLSVIIFSGCSQSRNLEKAHAFFQHITYGTIAVDDKGNQLTPGSKTERFIYMETKANAKPIINHIIYNGYDIKNPLLISVAQQTVNVGAKNSDNKQIVLVPAKGNRLWKIELSIPEKEIRQDKPEVITINENTVSVPVDIIIKGKYGGRAFTFTINEAVELRPVMGL